jgi:hypothetical protein
LRRLLDAGSVLSMDDLNAIDRHVERLRGRLVSALAFAAAAAAAALVPAIREYLLLVGAGAAGWASVEAGRLMLAATERRSVIDRMVLAGSRDPRCLGRRAELRSARSQHEVARMLRETCAQAHSRSPGGVSVVDRHTVRAVEHDLRELAALIDHDAGHLSPEAAIRALRLVSSPGSPLYDVHPDEASERRAIEATERMIDECRGEITDDPPCA